MANEIWASWPESETLYAIIRRQSDDKVYVADTGSDTFETWNDANLGTYDIPLSDNDGNYYSEDFPSDISDGFYYVQVFVQLGANPADGDWVLCHGWMVWYGGVEVSNQVLLAQIASIGVGSGGGGGGSGSSLSKAIAGAFPRPIVSVSGRNR